jgi:dihydroorotate dehydrogenase (NAD+) catalytic subunit
LIEITRPGKYSLVLNSPVMIASGMMGFDPLAYRDLLKLDKLGAAVTAPVSAKARKVAHGPRVVQTTGGMLLHTGLPHPGVNRVVKQYARGWERCPIPIIVHVIASNLDDITRTTERLEGVPNVVGVELGLHDLVHPDEVQDILSAARARCQLPMLVKLPLYQAQFLWEVVEMCGADAMVVSAPPRGTERDPQSGRLVGGRMYGRLMKGQNLRLVGQIASNTDTPIIACGGIHTPDDARDFLDAGARAVQIDTLTWISPRTVEVIARNLGGEELTRAHDALPDEWHPGIGKTQAMQRRGAADNNTPSSAATPPATPAPPPDLPELPLTDDDHTLPADPTDL